MVYIIKISFKNSASTYYETAVFYAGKFEKFKKSESKRELNILEIHPEELQSKIASFNSLWGIIKSWKGTEIFLNDKPVDHISLSFINEVTSCYSNYCTAIIQEKHCKINGSKDGWGCKLLSSIDRHPTENYYAYNLYNKWYEFGDFLSDTSWKVNKQRIKELLVREKTIKYLDLCPVFNQEKMFSILEELPEIIEIDKSEIWEVKYDENIDGNILEKKPIGIKQKRVERNVNGLNLQISVKPSDLESDINNKNNRFIPKVTYDEVGGIDGILQNIREVIEIPLKNPKLFEHLGITPHKGILLYGPPGCGKTLIAKAIANQVNAHFISIKGPELISKWHGQSEENLRNIFEEARSLEPAIVFFDELDSIAQRRSSEESLRVDAKFVNQLLTLMDGIEEYANVRVIATTNRLELIDEALLRPGRFDYHIQVDKPNAAGCYKILKIQTDKMPIAKDFSIENFSAKLIGLTGAEIAFVAREAAYNCLRRQLDTNMSNRDYKFDNLSFVSFFVNEEDFLKSLNSVKEKSFAKQDG